MSDQQEENPYYRRVHRERPKMKIPGLGSIGAGGGKGDIYTRLLPLVIIAFIGYAVYDTFVSINRKNRNVVEGASAIRNMTWNQEKVFKKYADMGKKAKHFYLVIGKPGATKTIDFGEESSGFWDLVDPYNHLTKEAGSLKVTVDAYDNTRDRTVEMKFE